MTANQEEISNHETFQLEFEPKEAKWAIRTMQDKYFRSSHNNIIFSINCNLKI